VAILSEDLVAATDERMRETNARLSAGDNLVPGVKQILLLLHGLLQAESNGSLRALAPLQHLDPSHLPVKET